MFKEVIFLLVLACLGLAEGGRFGYRTDEWFLRQSCEPGRIVGGTDAKLGEFPHQVFLAFPPIGFCGGSILSEKVILNAAHCAMHIPKEPSKAPWVTAGMVSFKNPGPYKQVSGVKATVLHPNFTSSDHKSYLYDIALIILDKPFTFNKYVQPVALPEPGAKFTGMATISGWGRTSNTTTLGVPDVLQKIEVPLVDFELCKEKWKNRHLDELSNICTGPLGGSLSACKGDSGGPVTKDVNGTMTVIGIVSWVQWPCGHGLPSVHTRVSSFIDFIKNNMEQSLD